MVKEKELYHRSYTVVKEPRVMKRTRGRNGDFGDAFYLTEIEDQAIRWATIKAANEDMTEGVINIYNLNYEKVIKTFRHKKFENMDKEYLDFVARSRKGEENEYDIIEGEVADDKIHNYVDGYLQGKISYEEFLEKAKFKRETHQIAMKENVLSCLDYVGHYLVDLNGRRIR